LNPLQGDDRMIYRKGKAPRKIKVAVYKCPKCGFDAEIAGFIRKENVDVKCACGQLMVRAVIGEDRKSHLQLVLQLEERRN
jgi:hypothetical protein